MASCYPIGFRQTNAADIGDIFLAALNDFIDATSFYFFRDNNI